MSFKSFIPETYKIGLIKSLLFRCFSLSSDFIKFHHEIDKLKSILYKNSYPRDLIDKCIKEFLDKILTPKPVVSTVPKKELIITLPYLGKMSLQIHTRISRIMKNKVRTVMSILFSRPSAKLVTFLHLKSKFHRSCVLAFFTNFSAVAAMLPIMAKLSVILKSEFVNTLEILHSLGKELQEMMILPLKNTFYSAITHPTLKISQFLLPARTTLKLY